MATDYEDIKKRLREKSVDDGECRIWTGHKLGKHKYGGLKVGRLTKYAHRLSYEAFKGEIPAGMLVMHTCDRPACINPDHLVLGTQKDNMDDMRSKGREPSNRAEDNGRSKLTWQDVERIRARYKRYCRKDGTGAMAKEFGVRRQTILSVLSHNSWQEN